MLARLIATVVHEIVEEYRRLDDHGQPAEGAPVSLTAADTSIAEDSEHDPRITLGFSLPPRREVP